MIKNSKVGHNQEIDFSSRKLENASTVGKNGHLRRDYWHLNKEQNKGKYEKNDSEKNTTAVVIDEDVVVLSLLKSKSVSMLLIMMLNGLLILQPPTILSLRRGCIQSRRLWYNEDG